MVSFRSSFYAVNTATFRSSNAIKNYSQIPYPHLTFCADGNAELSVVTNEDDNNESDKSTRKDKALNFADHLTPAEKRYIEQREQLDVHKYAKMSKNSHRDRLDDFNQYLANLSEHYDIPKVGPG